MALSLDGLLGLIIPSTAVYITCKCIYDGYIDYTNDKKIANKKKQDIIDSYLINYTPKKTITERFEDAIVNSGFSLDNSIVGNDKLTAIAYNQSSKTVCLLTRDKLDIRTTIIQISDIVSINPEYTNKPINYTISNGKSYTQQRGTFSILFGRTTSFGTTQQDDSHMDTVYETTAFIRLTVNNLTEPQFRLSFMNLDKYSSNHSIEEYYKWCSILEVLKNQTNTTI
jgi:hypothetical protein